MELIVPARLPEPTLETVRRLAVEVFTMIGCSGMARVDFFVENDQVLVNELNTIPGFTPTSVYAKLLEADGIAYAELLDRLVALALERHASSGGTGTDDSWGLAPPDPRGTWLAYRWGREPPRCLRKRPSAADRCRLQAHCASPWISTCQALTGVRGREPRMATCQALTGVRGREPPDGNLPGANGGPGARAPGWQPARC